MIDKDKIIALIPARGNSKSIPRKNIRDFAGYPLIAYSIAAGLRSKFVGRVIVSTDSSEIAKIAKDYGAEVPFLRPAEFAQDDTLDMPVFLHALTWLLEHKNFQPQIIVQLRPTSPIRTVDCVDEAINTLINNPQADSVRGVVPAAQNPFKMWRIDEDGKMLPLLKYQEIKEPYNAPRQDLPAVYWQTGHIDAIRLETIINKNSLSGDVIFPLFIDPEYTVDIDTPNDWKRAEILVQSGQLEMVCPNGIKKKLPAKIELLVLDFDGVFTDDRVWVDQDGREMVAANRSDGYGIEMLRKKTAIEIVVISKEENRVVAARCKKLGIECHHGIDDKAVILNELIARKRAEKSNVVFIGNDLNDLPCFELVGFSVAPSDAHLSVLKKADMVLSKPGGYGAIREFCDILLRGYE